MRGEPVRYPAVIAVTVATETTQMVLHSYETFQSRSVATHYRTILSAKITDNCPVFRDVVSEYLRVSK